MKLRKWLMAPSDKGNGYSRLEFFLTLPLVPIAMLGEWRHIGKAATITLIAGAFMLGRHCAK